MHLELWLPALAVLVALALGAWAWRSRRRVVRTTPLAQAKQRFHVQRERLEAKFIQLATAHASHDAPQWADCTFDDDVAYVRNRTTGELKAFVAVTITSDNLDAAIRGTPEAIGNLQGGTAIFRLDRDHWETDGQAILNLSPSEAVLRFRDDFEVVAEECARRV